MKQKRNYNEKSKKNLISIADRSPEERQLIAQKSAATRRANSLHNKTVKEVADAILKLSGKDLTSVLDNETLKEKAAALDLSIYDVMMFKMVDQSLKGSVKAFETVRDSAGDKPINRTESNVNIINENDTALLNKIADRLGIETQKVIDGDFKEL